MIFADEDPFIRSSAPQQVQCGAPPPQQQWNNAGPPPPVPQHPTSYQNNNYGQPPPQNSYSNQTNSYGAPPPPNSYGAPPPNNAYGAPPLPQNSYGAPPPQNQHGAPAPPPNQYGAPPPQQPMYGGAPQQLPYSGSTNGADPIYFLGTEDAPLEGMSIAMPLAAPGGYNPQFDVPRIRAATKGFGTDEVQLISCLVPLTALQMHALSRAYEANVGRSLIKTIEKETRGWFEWSLRGLVLGPLGFDVWLLNHAMKGMGTNEE
jgi:annexin A7/11